MKKLLTWSIIGASLLFFSCGDDKDEPSNPSNTKSKTELTNEWIHQKMSDEYLWNMDVPRLSSLNTKSSHADFFASLLSDQEAKYTSSNRKYYYSHITTSESTKAASFTNSYGIFFIRYLVSDTQEILRVLFVNPGSAAEKSGIKRGDWLIRYNGAPITDYTKLQAGGEAQVTRGHLEISGGQYNIVADDTFTLQASYSIEETPFLKEEIIEVNSTKIGYLAYNSFSTGPNGFEDKSWDNQMIAAFGRFKTAGVSEFVLDLRYNGGGYISSCQILSTMLVKQANINSVFSIQEYNPTLEAKYVNNFGSNHGVTQFSSSTTVRSNNLNLDRLYVIGTEYTASASELVINALRPYMSVKHIGTVTEGKNVGSYEIKDEVNHPGVILQPITVKIYNSKRESNYRDGFTPDIYIDELNETNLTIPLGELGDYNSEPLLRAALVDMGIVNYSLSSTSSVTISANNLKSIGTHLSKPKDGLIVLSPER
ncbi:MAG: S41 family peptidase [Bacteroidales bacterium]